MKKAEFVCAWNEKGKGRILQYRYRDHLYTVQDLGWTGFSLANQHRQEQTYIDSLIEQEERAKAQKGKKEIPDAWEDFDFFWNYINN